MNELNRVRAAGRPSIFLVATAVALIAALAGTLSGCAARQVPSPATSGATSPVSAPDSPAPVTPSPTPYPTWAGARALVIDGGRVGSDLGWAVTYDPGRLYVTDDGGNTWRNVTPPNLKLELPSSTDHNGPVGLAFADSLNGWFFYERGEHTFYRTTDGGRTWARSVFPAPAACLVKAADWLDNRRGMVECNTEAAEGLRGQLWTTEDGGRTWTLMATADGSNPATVLPDLQVKLVTPLEAWGSASVSAQGNPQLVHSLDGGKTWTARELPSTGTFVANILEFPTTRDGRLVVSATVVTTHEGQEIGLDFMIWTSADGGEHWTVETVKDLGTPSTALSAGSTTIPYGEGGATVIRLLDPTSGTFTASIPTTQLCPGGADGTLIDAWAASSTDVWATCGCQSPVLIYLYRTTDGGKTWQPLMGTP